MDKFPLSQFGEIFEAFASPDLTYRNVQSARQASITHRSNDFDDDDDENVEDLEDRVEEDLNQLETDRERLQHDMQQLPPAQRGEVAARLRYMEGVDSMPKLKDSGMIYDPVVHGLTAPFELKLPHSIVTEMLGCAVLLKGHSGMQETLRAVHLMAAVGGWFILAVQAYLSWYVQYLEDQDPLCESGDPLIRLLCMGLWGMVMLNAMYHNFIMLRYIHELPRWHPRMEHLLHDIDGFCQLLYKHVRLPANWRDELPPTTIRVPVTGITHLQRVYMYACVLAELFTKSALVYFGMGFIAKTEGNSSKILNTMGLGFIAEIDDIALSLLLPGRLQENTAWMFPPLHLLPHQEDDVSGQLSFFSLLMIVLRPVYSVAIFCSLVFFSFHRFCGPEASLFFRTL